MTPLPAAKPSALMTKGGSFDSSQACAFLDSLNTWCSAVGMLWRCRKSLAKDLDPSSWAALPLGPRQRNPFSVKRSTIPSTSGPSGPMTVKLIPSSWANSQSRSVSSAAIAMFSTPFSCAVPAFPGATNTVFIRSDCASFQARACSLPPLPTTSTFAIVFNAESDACP